MYSLSVETFLIFQRYKSIATELLLKLFSNYDAIELESFWHSLSDDLQEIEFSNPREKAL